MDLAADPKTPAIVRATAVSLVAEFRGQDAVIRRAAADEDPLVRQAAASALDQTIGNLDAADREYHTAIERQPQFVPGYLNLADLNRQCG